MLIRSAVFVYAAIVSIQCAPTPNNYTTSSGTTEPPDSIDWAKIRFISYVIFGILGLTSLFILAWCAKELKRKPADLLCCCKSYCQRCCKRPWKRVSTQEDGMANNTPKLSLKDPFEEKQFKDVIDLLRVPILVMLFKNLNNLTAAKISHCLETLTVVADDIKAHNVFTRWIEKTGVSATRQAVVDAVEKSGEMEAKDALFNHWKDSLDQQCDRNDIDTVMKTGKLAWIGVFNMFCNMGLDAYEVQLYCNAEEEDVSLKSKKVFTAWINTRPRPTIKTILEAVEKVDKDAADDLRKKWKISTPQETAI